MKLKEKRSHQITFSFPKEAEEEELLLLNEQYDSLKEAIVRLSQRFSKG